MKKNVLFASLAVACLLGAAHSAQAQGAIVDGATYKLTHYGVVADGSEPLVPAGSALCLDVDNNSPNAGTSIGQWGDNGNNAQRFIFELQADGSYKFRHKGTVLYVQPVVDLVAWNSPQARVSPAHGYTS